MFGKLHARAEKMLQDLGVTDPEIARALFRAIKQHTPHAVIQTHDGKRIPVSKIETDE